MPRRDKFSCYKNDAYALTRFFYDSPRADTSGEHTKQDSEVGTRRLVQSVSQFGLD